MKRLNEGVSYIRCVGLEFFTCVSWILGSKGSFDLGLDGSYIVDRVARQISGRVAYK